MNPCETDDPTMAPSRGLAVLLVDDHPLVPMALRNLLEQRFEGLRCLQASSIRQARSVYQDEPSLLATVLDVNLPDVKGLDGLQELLGVRSTVPVIVFTGLDNDALRCNALTMGAAAVVCKNENVLALVDTLFPLVAQHLPASILVTREPILDLAAEGLSSRQQQIWQALAEGLSNVEISARYRISLNTTKAHVRELLQRLGARNRTEAAARYYRARLDGSGR